MDVHTSGVGRQSDRKESAFLRYLRRRNENHPAVPLLFDLAGAILLYFFTKTHLLFGAYPLGIAALAAMSGPATIAALIGGLLGTVRMGLPGYVWGALLLVTVGMRTIISRPNAKGKLLPTSRGFFREAPQLRAAVACIVGFAASLYQLFVAGVTTATLLFAVTMLLSTTVISLLFVWLFDSGMTVEEIRGQSAVSRSSLGEFYMQLGALSLGFFTVLALKGIVFFGLNVAFLFAAIVTLCLSRRYGALRGCVAGLLMTVGIAPLYAPAFAILGLLSGILFELGAVYALSLGVAGAAAWCTYVGRLEGFLSVVPEMTIVALLSFPILRLFRRGEAVTPEVKAAAPDRQAVLDEVTEGDQGENALHTLGEGLLALGAQLRSIADGRDAPERADYLIAAESVCHRHCAECEKRMACWQEGDAPILSAIDRMADLLGEGREVSRSCFKGISCPASDAIVAEIKTAAQELTRAFGANRRTGAAAEECELLAKLIFDTEDGERAAKESGREAEKRIVEALAAVGLTPAVRTLTSSAGMKVYLAFSEASEPDAEAIREIVSAAVGMRVSTPLLTIADSVTVLAMQCEPRYVLETYRATRSAKGGEVSGDSIEFFERGDGMFYALLSDGMGSGRYASVTSNISALTLSALISHGVPRSASLKLLNHLLREGGEGSAATVDLLEFNRADGSLSFIKSGAAPSYIKRGEGIFRVRSKTMPMGMLRSPDAERVRFESSKGDLIVMLSDGIGDPCEDAPYLMRLLSGKLEVTLPELGEQILAAAAKARGEDDDMSVILLRVAEVGGKIIETPEKPAGEENPASDETAENEDRSVLCAEEVFAKER